MIKIRNVNKFFNKNKSNEIHVINNTTLEFPNTGLVCLLGPSGSGKTTLLNVVGGLDKIDSGEINFKNYKINRYKANKWDFIRNHHFGYIFQNYILLPELTVYQNLELVLKMLGLSKEEINERIDYALEAVGMIKFKKRKPTQLSGGQQQRIAIARALVKSPDVVIADEPTGNLDEKNTTQIMNIIKKISKECLVILVTHERRLAEFYGDRIIEISDGKVVSDRLNSHNNVLSTQDDLNIYLQDFVKEDVANEDVNIKYFYGEEKQKLNLNIIFKDNTFYIHSPHDNIKIKFLDSSSEIKVIDAKKPTIDMQHVEEFEYHLPKLEAKTGKTKSVVTFLDTVKLAFRHLGNLRRRQKLMFVVLFFAAIMITIGFINFFTSRRINEEDFLYFNRNIVIVDDDFAAVESELGDGDLAIVHPNQTVVGHFNNGYFKQNKDMISVRNKNNGFMTSAIPFSILNNPSIYNGLGRLPEKPGEAVIDKSVVDIFLKTDAAANAGIKSPEQIIGLTFSGENQKKIYGLYDSYRIVGIVNTNEQNIYVEDISYINTIITSHHELEIFESLVLSTRQAEVNKYYKLIDTMLDDELTTVLDFNLAPNQAIVNPLFYNRFIKNSGKTKFNIGLGYEVEVVGVLNYIDEVNPNASVMYISDDLSNSFYQEYIKNDISTFIYSDNPTELINKLQNKGIKADLFYDYEIDRLMVRTLDLDLFITSLVILAASLVFLYFLMRSSLISRIYEVGVYRALGINKLNIYKIFFTEILIITFITSFLGILAVSLFVNEANKIMDLIYYPLYIPLLSLLFILVVNTIVGLLPISNLLRLTPSQILSKYDM